MTMHTHTWKSVTEWCDVAAEAGWQVAAKHRFQHCNECNTERNLHSLGRRRRQRLALVHIADEPDDLRIVASERRWRTANDALQILGITRLELERDLGDWVQAGWIEVEEAKQSYRDEWIIERFRLSSAAYTLLVEQPRLERQQARDADKSEALTKLLGWQADLERALVVQSSDDELMELLHRVSKILVEQENALHDGQWVALPDTTLRLGDAPHRRRLYALRGVVDLLAADRWEYERAFSARWLGHSKALALDRRAWADYLGLPLERLGLFSHTPVMYCWGAFTAHCQERLIDGQAGIPFVALSAETVRDLQIRNTSTSSILVIENQTAFEYLLRPPLRQPNLLYLFSSGHPGHAEREFLAKCLQFAPKMPWYVWTDWDYGGVRIQLDWARWAKSKALSMPYPWWWEDARLTSWAGGGTPLREDVRAKLQQLAHPLAETLIRAGFTLEQEAVLYQLNETDIML
jgi:hypothetical protein